MAADLGNGPIAAVAARANGRVTATAYPSPPLNHHLSFSPPHTKSSYHDNRPAAAVMSTSLSPQHQHHQSSQSPLGGSSSSQQDSKSPLSSLNLGFLKGLTEKRTTREGNPPKRRGPKPDSKPALTRRQELNRQAQRTHRERKELYIKALEDEVLRLKEIYSNISQDKERLAEENRQLKALLSQNGMSSASAPMAGGSLLDESMSNPSIGYTSSGSISGAGGAPSSYTSAFTPPAQARGTSPNTQHNGHNQQYLSSGQGVSGSGAAATATGGSQQNRNPLVDYDQAGIDFVLTLEKPCMDHMPWLLERGIDAGGGEPCGHALMASCPPEPFPELTPDIPFGYSNVNVNNNNGAASSGPAAAQRTWELSKGDLSTLLDLSKRLDLDGEITPVMAWGMVLAHPRLDELNESDFVKITDELGSKVRCYGFGAVMEEFEVRDALENVFSTKPDMAMTY